MEERYIIKLNFLKQDTYKIFLYCNSLVLNIISGEGLLPTVRPLYTKLNISIEYRYIYPIEFLLYTQYFTLV